MAQGTAKRPISLNMPALVVDDSRVNCEIVAKIIKGVGFSEAKYCLSGAEALSELRTLRYGIVITDLEMTPMSGLDLINCIRNDQMIRTIPVVLMTGNEKEVARMVLQHEVSKADIHVLKPFTPDTLATKLSTKFSLEPAVRDV